MGLCWLDLVELLEQLAGIEFSVVFALKSLNCLVDAVGVGPAKQFCQLAGPVHGLPLDLNGFRFVHLDHVIHSPDVATWFHCDGVS